MPRGLNAYHTFCKILDGKMQVVDINSPQYCFPQCKVEVTLETSGDITKASQLDLFGMSAAGQFIRKDPATEIVHVGGVEGQLRIIGMGGR